MPFIYGPNGGSDILEVPGGYAILEDSGITEAVTETGPMATVKYKVYDSNQRYSFVNQLLGQWTGTPPSNIFYSLPFAYPASPNLLCTSVPAIESLGRKVPMLGVGLPYWFGQYAVVTAVFTRPPWQAATNAGFFSINFAAAAEVITIPETVMTFADGTPTTTPPALLMPQAQVTVTRFRMPFLPDAIAAQLLGKLNNAPFQIGWNIYDTGTLIFSGMSSEIAPDPLGNIAFTVVYIFIFRPVDWNYEIYPGSAGGFQVVKTSGGNTKYSYVNFNLLP